MKINLSAYGKKLALALFVLAAGCCYSCGYGAKTIPFAQLSSETNAGAVPDTGEAGGTKGEKESGTKDEREAGPDDGERIGENDRKENSGNSLCYVHVCGEVVHPGVYRLSEGQRVFEAVELAGGFTDDAADSYLNLAETVHDGMKVEVPSREKAAAMESEPETAQDAKRDGRINLNTATREELMTLRGIGQARAEDIIAWRQKQGGFKRIEEIMEVPGIKEAAFEKIRDYITID